MRRKKHMKGNSLSVKLTSVLLAFLFIISPIAPVLAAEDSATASGNAASTTVTTTDSSTTTETTASAETVSDSKTDTAVDLAAPEKDSTNSQKGKDKTGDTGGVQAMSTSTTDGYSSNSTDPKNLDKNQLPQSETLTGALTYEYPIIVPPGRSGLQPDLKLTYNSQSGDEANIIGYGWNISIPYIERINRKGTDKLYTENYFNSSLSGELISLGGTSYGSKVDNGEFLKYEFSNNSWLVTDKQGTKYKFGYSAATRQDDPTDSAKVFKWMLEEIRDTNDNFIRYEYFKDQGQIYPSKIFYTGSGSTDGIFEVEFLRQTRTDASFSYRAGFKIQTNYRVNEIQAKINASWTRKYSIAYTTGDDSNRSLISSIIETGKDESSGVEVSLPATTFNYQNNASGSWTLDPSFFLPLSFHGINSSEPEGTRAVDINGDGLVDIIRLIDFNFGVTIQIPSFQSCPSTQ